MRKSIADYHLILKNLGCGFAYQRIILDKNGNPEDFEFLEVNPAFEKLTGLKEQDIIGKRATEIFSDIKKREFNWIKFYGKVAISGKSSLYEFYSNSLEKWVEVFAHCPEMGYFITEFRDITRNKQAEEKLRESEEKYRLLSEYSGIGMGLYNTDGEILMFNQQALKDMGGKAEDFIGKSLLEVYGSNEGEEYLKRIKLAAVSETPLEYEDFVHLPSGDRWFLSSYAGIRNSEAKLIGVQILAKEITGRKKAEEELKNDEFLLKESQRIGLIGSYVYNIEKDVWISSEVLDDIFGIERNSEKNLLSWNALIHPEQKEEMLKYFKKHVFKQKNLFDKEYKIIRPKDGATRWLWGRGELKFNDSGTPVRMIGTIQDITERKQAEEEIRRSRKEFKNYFDSGSTGLSVTAHDKTWIEVNQRLCKMLGYTKKELTGLTWDKITHPDDISENIKFFQQVLNGKIDKFELDKRFIRKDGGIVYITLSTVCQRNDDGSVHHFLSSYIDITERKRMEEGLRTILRTTIDGYYLVDKDGRFLDTNDSYCSMIGYTREEMLTMSVADVEAIETPEIIAKRIHRIMQNGSERFETKHKCKDGRIIDIEASVNLLQDAEIKIVVFMRNVTERKRAEEAVKISEERFKQVAESSGHWVWEVNVDGVYTFVSESEENILGYKPEEVIGKKHFYDFFSPDVRTELTKAAFEVFSNKESFNDFENPNINKDGHTVILKTSGFPMLDAKGNLTGYRGTDKDITEQKRAEKELSENTKVIHDLYDNAPCGYHSLDATGKYILINDTELRIIGYSRVEIIGKKKFKDLLTPKSKNLFNKVYPKFLEVGWVNDIEYEVIRKDGTVLPVLLSATAVKDENGIFIMSRATIFDNTERNHAKNELIKAKEKAEEMNRLKSSFLANMSHELRTPMVAILGYAELLCENLKESKERDMAKTLLKGGKRLTNTLNLILELSRVEASKTEVHINPVNISESTEYLVKLYQQEAVKKNLILSSDLSIEVIALVDIEMYEKIVDNLIQNALKYTDKGEVKVTTGFEKNNNEITFIKVQDTGIGIPETMLDSIFEPFRQVSEGHSRQYEGTGLGLSITKNYVDLMNGSIEVKSELDKGSVFTVKFPSGKMMMKAKKEKIITRITDKPRVNTESKIAMALIVEDDEMSIDMMKYVLKDICKYDIVQTGEEALKSAGEKDYSIVLMDIGLSGMSGIEATQKMRKIPGYEKKPIVAVTAYAMAGDKEKFLIGGCTDYISKPFDTKDFQVLIKKYL